MSDNDRAEYPKYIEHFGIHAVVNSAEEESTFLALPEPPAHAAKQKNIDALVQGRRDMEVTAQAEIDQWKLDDEAMKARRDDILARHQAGRDAADARMTQLGGTWPDDLEEADKAHRMAPKGNGRNPKIQAPPDTSNVPAPVSKLGDPAAVSNNPAVAANPVPDELKAGDIATGGADTSSKTEFVPPATT